MSSSNVVEGLCGRCFCLRPLPLLNPIPPLPPYTLYSIRAYCILFHTGKEGELNQREG